jgi:toxin ParE1/3/4
VIPYSFHPEAEAEFADAARLYESRVTGLGRHFSAEVQRIISHIREYPDAGTPVRLPVRRTLVACCAQVKRVILSKRNRENDA